MRKRLHCDVCEALIDLPLSEPDVLSNNGWLAIWVRLEFDGITITTRGGWLCPDCVSRNGIRLRQSMRQNAALKNAR